MRSDYRAQPPRRARNIEPRAGGVPARLVFGQSPRGERQAGFPIAEADPTLHRRLGTRLFDPAAGICWQVERAPDDVECLVGAGMVGRERGGKLDAQSMVAGAVVDVDLEFDPADARAK